MIDDDRPFPRRRQFLLGLAAAGSALAVSPRAAQGAMPTDLDGPGARPPAPKIGLLGKAGHGPGRPVIAMLVYDKMIMQDLVGPLTVFNLMQAEIHLVSKSLAPVVTELGVPITPSTSFTDCPDPVDVLFVPGGLQGSIDMMQDEAVLAFLADRGSRARYVTSDCTGSLVLGAAGLLRGYRATSHWYVRDELMHLGAIPTHERVVRDRNRLTGGGVTAGLDFGLTLCALLKGRPEAERIQLTLEYAPAPPFDAGEPETAPRLITEAVLASRRPVIEQARMLAIEAAKAFR